MDDNVSMKILNHENPMNIKFEQTILPRQQSFYAHLDRIIEA